MQPSLHQNFKSFSQANPDETEKVLKTRVPGYQQSCQCHKTLVACRTGLWVYQIDWRGHQSIKI